MPRLLSAACVLLVAGACSVDAGSSDADRPTTSTTTTTVAETATEAPTTTLPASTGIVEVAGETYEFAADCYAPGVGEVLATGLTTTDDGARVEVYVQAFLGQPYLGISVIGDTTTVYEAAVDRPLDIFHIDDIIRADDIALVTDLDLETGIGTDAGVGTIVVECRSYAEAFPAGFGES